MTPRSDISSFSSGIYPYGACVCVAAKSDNSLSLPSADSGISAFLLYGRRDLANMQFSNNQYRPSSAAQHREFPFMSINKQSDDISIAS